MGKSTEIVPAVEVQPAVNIEQAKAELRPLLKRIEEGEAALQMGQQAVHDWRRQAGAICLAVRKTIPQSGRNAKAWGEFLTEMGLTASTAGNYMKLAEFADRYPTEAATISVGEIYKRLGIGLPAPAAILASTCEKGPEAPKPAAAKQKTSAVSPEKSAEIPKTPEKPKATSTRIDKRDSQENYDPEGPPARVDEPRETGAETLDRIKGEFKDGGGDSAADDEPTVDERETAQLDAEFRKVEADILSLAERHSKRVGRLYNLLMGVARTVGINAKQKGQL